MSRRSKRKNKQRNRAANGLAVKPRETLQMAERLRALDVPTHEIASIISRTVYQGPIPPPDLLEEFDRVAPGTAQKLIDQFVKQSDHRMHLEKTVIASDIRRSWGGLCAGLFIALVFAGISVYALAIGHPFAAAVIGSFDLASLVYVFVSGKAKRNAELQKKSELVKR